VLMHAKAEFHSLSEFVTREKNIRLCQNASYKLSIKRARSSDFTRKWRKYS